MSLAKLSGVHRFFLPPFFPSSLPSLTLGGLKQGSGFSGSGVLRCSEIRGGCVGAGAASPGSSGLVNWNAASLIYYKHFDAHERLERSRRRETH